LALNTKKSLVKSRSELSIERQCALLGLNVSTYYTGKRKRFPVAPPPVAKRHLLCRAACAPAIPTDKSAEKIAREERLMAAIDRWHTEMPYLGARKLVAKLDEDGLKTNRKEVRRLMAQMGIYAIYPKPNLSRPHKEHKKYPYLLRNKAIFLPNQVWAVDITYIKMSHGHLYLTAMIDWYSRLIVGWALSDTLDTAPVLKTVTQAIEAYGVPSIINSDQGSQFTSDEYTSFLAKSGIRQSMDGKARWVDNVIIERWFRSLKCENIYINEYTTPNELRRGIAAYIAEYNDLRPHQSLENAVPDSVYRRCFSMVPAV
jgi:putative transposase